MMSSCGGGIARRRGDHDSVDKLAEFDKPVHWQPWISYNSRKAGLARHPGRKNECRTVIAPDQYVFDAAVLIPASQDEGLPSQRMKRIRDRNFLRWNPGTMNPLRTGAVSAPPQSTHWFRLPSSTMSIRRLGSLTSSRVCRIIRPSGSTSSCPGTGGPNASKKPLRSDAKQNQPGTVNNQIRGLHRMRTLYRTIRQLH